MLCGSICLVETEQHTAVEIHLCYNCVFGVFLAKKEEAARSVSVLGSFGPHPKEHLLTQKSSCRAFGHLQ